MNGSVATPLNGAIAINGLSARDTRMKMHEILRVPQRERDRELFDGLRNIYVVTGGRDKEVPFGRGINPIAIPRSLDRPAILISSSPWKAGSVSTPWHDVFDIHSGHVRYFGDSKARPTTGDAADPGNTELLRQFGFHKGSTPEERGQAAPLLVFRSVTRNGATKGFREFCGLGVIDRAERIVQWDESAGSSFSNYVYDIALLDLAPEHECFDWRWVNRRAEVGAESALPLAPASWRRWVRQGGAGLGSLRRNAFRSRTVDKPSQLPPPGSHEDKVLNQIYRAFDDRKHAFEWLASRVTARILGESANRYYDGWITKASGDRGIDFVSRMDLGAGSTRVKVAILGQAKCVEPRATSISAGDLARVVARLRRGWIGAYVTTGTYSRAAQEELLMDEYPILLVDGRSLAEQVRLLASEVSGGDIDRFLKQILAGYDDVVVNRSPEEILLL